MKTLFTLLALCALAGLPAAAQTQGPMTYHTTLFGQLNPAQGQGGRYSALWGYTAPNGREYALLGGNTGTHIIDITDKPVKQVAFITGPTSGWREMKTYGTYAYVVSEGGGGLQIIDLSNLPASATLVKSDTTFFRTGHTISQTGPYLYVNGTNGSAGAGGGTMILNIIEPTQPRMIGKYTLRYVHDAIVHNDTMYTAEINNGQLSIVDVTDKATPKVVAEIKYPGGGTHNSDLTEKHDFLMTTDEIGSTPKTLKVWDVRDRNNITKVADYTPVPNQIIHNVHNKGRLAFVAWYSAGTRIIDMSDPRNPAEVGYFDTYDGAVEDYVGNWETYPYFASGKIISSDMQTGLHVFTFDGAQRGSVAGRVLDAVTSQPIPNATVTLTRSGGTITTDALGRYTIAGVAGDTADYWAVAENYFGAGGSIVLTSAGAAKDIRLNPITLATLNLRVTDAATGQLLAIPYAHRVIERQSAQGVSAQNPRTLKLPRDSAYTVYVGAWGYIGQHMEVVNTGQTVDVALVKGYADDAEVNLGWSLNSPSDNASGGFWERGSPEETINNGSIQTGMDHTVGEGNYAFITGLTAEGQPGGNDVDNGRVTLTSPPMDLSAYNDPRINCWVWYSRDRYPDQTHTDDTLEILISNDNGATWMTLERYWSSPQNWTKRTYRIKDVVMPGAQTLFRIVASDLNSGSWLEAGLDDFSVTDVAGVESPGTTPAHAAARVVPNPAMRNGAGPAALQLDLPAAQRSVVAELYNGAGARVATLHDGPLGAGSVRLPLPLQRLACGVYVWRVRGADGLQLSGSVTVR